MYRRQLLGAVFIAVTSGCLSPLEEDREGPSSVTLGRIEITNADETPHEVEIELHASGEVVYQETHSIGTEWNENSRVIERTWPKNVEQYTIRARVDDQDWRQFVFDEPHPNTCHIAAVSIRPNGEFDIFYSTAGADETEC